MSGFIGSIDWCTRLFMRENRGHRYLWYSAMVFMDLHKLGPLLSEFHWNCLLHSKVIAERREGDVTM